MTAYPLATVGINSLNRNRSITAILNHLSTSNESVETLEVYNHYLEYCKQNNIDPVSKAAIAKTLTCLKKKGVVTAIRKPKPKSGVWGISMTNYWEIVK